MMNIYKRPLFRQAGGPAAPMAMDMPAMAVIPPEMQAQVQQAEQSAAGEMEGYGRAYVEEMMTGLDSAESAEEVINAIRGNAQPIDSRYDELAGIVGIEDARATPESVLALVQPTMMMTEQGAMDTGIGELMQSLTGGVEMEDEQGMATPMGQGVGELMMGAPAAEPMPMPVQQYYQGGYVQKLQLGGPPRSLLDQASGFQAMTAFDPGAVKESYEARKDLYEELLGDTDNRRKQAQSSLFFDIAKAGLNLAGGVDPSTGQSMTGAPLGAQIARAALPVAESAQRAGAEVTDAQRGARVAALQSAEAEQQARLAQVGREREGLLSGGIQSGIQLQQNEFVAGENQLGRDFTRGENESQRDFQERIANLEIGARKTLQELQGDQQMNQLIKGGELRSALQGLVDQGAMNRLIRQGEISTALEQLGQEGRLALQNVIGEQALSQLDARAAAERSLFDAETARRANEIQANFENTLERDGVLNSYEMERFSDQLEAEYERMDRQLGGEGQLFGYAPLGFFKSTTFAELAEDAQRYNQDFQTRQSFLSDQWNGLNYKLAQDRFAFERMGFEAEMAMRQAQMQNQAQIAALGAMQKAQYTFGNSIEGVAKDMVSNMELLRDYELGRLDEENPNALNMLNTAIAYYATPKTQYDPNTGQFVEQRPIMPRQLQDALRGRQERGLSSPFAYGGEVRKYQLGGEVTSGVDPKHLMTLGNYLSRDNDKRIPMSALMASAGSQDWDRVNEMLSPSTNVMEETDIELPGRIIPENADLTPGVGVSTLLSPIRTIGSYAREVGLTDREAPFSEIADAQTQLTSLANVTQRFVRESVGSKALKAEVDALAEELGKPGVSTEEATLEKLTNMRNQLLEIQDLAVSMLETPEKFTSAQVTTARQDFRRLSPLIENYDRAILNFENALNPNKPDPSMFEGR